MSKQIVLITGGSRGIGFGIAKFLLKNHFKVVINFHSNQSRADIALKELKTISDDVIAIRADVTVKEERIRLLKETIEHFGRIDLLVNNAAVATRYGFLKTTEEEFDRLYNCNVKAPVFLGKIVAEQMIEQGDGGSIINICSIAGHRPGVINYSDSKAALLMATKNMAAKLGKYNIRVNSISPGTFVTDLNKHSREGTPDIWKETIEKYPLQRAGDPEEMGSTVLYLATDASKFVTGIDIVVDGGCLAARSF